MRIHLTADQHAFFRKNRFLELEDVVPLEVAQAASDAIDHQLGAQSLGRISPTRAYQQGRDLWRRDEAVKRVSCFRPLAELCSELSGVRTIRIAYDQLLRTGANDQEAVPLVNTDLNSISSIQQIDGAVVVRLSPGGDDILGEEMSWLPRRCGSVVAVDPKIVLRFVDLYRAPCVNYLLVTYAGPRAIYVLNPKDSHTHSLKPLGYVFGDRLREETHPTLVRT